MTTVELLIGVRLADEIRAPPRVSAEHPKNDTNENERKRQYLRERHTISYQQMIAIG